jgi:hypothetical protein
MSKILLLSILIATIALPLRHAAAEEPQQAMRKMIIEFCWFNLFYVLALAHVIPRLL